MTISSELNRKEYAGNGVTTAFATSPVVFYEDSDLEVYDVVDATGVATLKTLTTHYTVSGGEGAVGTVTMLSAPATGHTLVIVRTLPLTQEVDFLQNDGSDAEVAEAVADRAILVDQQLQAQIDRSFRLADSDISDVDVQLPDATARALKIMGFDGDGEFALYDESSAVTASENVAFTQSGTGAVATTVEKKLYQLPSVFDFMTAAEIADVQAYAYTLDVSAALNAAFAAHKCISVPNGGYRVGSQLTMQADALILGSGKYKTIFKKYFNGDMFVALTDGVTITDMYFDGNGATYTGRIFPVLTGTGQQSVHRCMIMDAHGYCIEYEDTTAGSQSAYFDCMIRRYDGTTAGKYAIKVEDALESAAIPRKFIGCEADGGYFMDFGGSNGTTIEGGGFYGGFGYSDNSRGVKLIGIRWGNQAACDVKGSGHTITGCGILPALTLTSGTTDCSIKGNSYNSTITDSSGNGSNDIDICSVAYTPTITQASGSFVLGDGLLVGAYSRQGDVICYTVDLTIGSTTSFGTGEFRFSLPVTPNLPSGPVQTPGQAHLTDSGTTFAFGGVQIVNGATYCTLRSSATATPVGTASPWTWANGDIIRFTITYKV